MLTDVACVAGDEPVDPPDADGNITLGIGEDVSCTYTNDRQATEVEAPVVTQPPVTPAPVTPAAPAAPDPTAPVAPPAAPRGRGGAGRGGAGTRLHRLAQHPRRGDRCPAGGGRSRRPGAVSASARPERGGD